MGDQPSGMVWHTKLIMWLRTRRCCKYSSVPLSETLACFRSRRWHSFSPCRLGNMIQWKRGILSFHFLQPSISTHTLQLPDLSGYRNCSILPWATLSSTSGGCAKHATLAVHLEMSGYSGIRNSACSSEGCQLKICQSPPHSISVV